MADLVIGIGSSHGPSIQNEPEVWSELAKKDTRDPRFNYQELLKTARPGLDAEVTIEVQRKRHAAARTAMSALTKRITDSALDVCVVVSNEHLVRSAVPHPVFGILRAAEFPAAEEVGVIVEPSLIKAGKVGDWKGTTWQAPGHTALANHLIDGLIDDGFDIAVLDQLVEGTVLDEAFSFCFEWLFGEKKIPIVPLYLSRDLPNQATPQRCVALGKALRAQIEAYPEKLRVGVIASGGLSHQVLDETLDREVVKALLASDFAALGALSRPRLNRGPGTPEILNWITVAAAMAPRQMTLVDYLPCYRSVASTGHGVAFGYWS